ncbi:MAG: hypothetical protein AB7D57_09460 [Desulfovibrionaceae bacterium]
MLTLHIGVGKTATTSLQNLFFARHPGLRYLGVGHDLRGAHPEFRQAVLDLLQRDSLTWDPEPARRAADAALAEAGDRPVLYSNENILDSDRDKGQIMDRLRQAFAPCRILVTIREQRSFLRSLYGHDNNKLKGLPAPCNGRFISIEDWLDYHHGLLARERGWLWLGHYHHLARGLAAAFGPENVKFLLFEQFRADRTAFLRELCAFVGMEYDAGLDAGLGEKRLNAQRADRWLQKQLYMHGLRTRGSWLAACPALLRLAGAIHSNRHREPAPVRIDIPPDWDERLCALFRESNAALARATGLPLAQYGYAL